VISAAPKAAPRLTEIYRSRYAFSESSYLLRFQSTRYLVSGLTLRRRIAVLLPIAAITGAVAVGCALAAHGSTTTHVAAGAGSPSQLEIGKQLYRKYCGQCHALIAALAAGFGSDKGLGTDGGPSFNNLKVPYNLSIVAVTEQFGGHELVVKRMTWQQLGQVSSFVAAATHTNPYLARISDG
jgi:mono/diheme cytochrome c family protein